MTTYKEIPGWPDYRVGDDGSVWSCLQKRGNRWVRSTEVVWRLIRPKVTKGRYLQVGIRGGEPRKKVFFFVHRLVLLAFAGPKPIGMCTRHLDGNPQNNNLSNLCYGTYSENWHDKVLHGTAPVGEKHCRAKLTEAQVEEIQRRRDAGETVQSLADEYRMGTSSISRIGRRASWRYKDQNPRAS